MFNTKYEVEITLITVIYYVISISIHKTVETQTIKVYTLVYTLKNKLSNKPLCTAILIFTSYYKTAVIASSALGEALPCLP